MPAVRTELCSRVFSTAANVTPMNCWRSRGMLNSVGCSDAAVGIPGMADMAFGFAAEAPGPPGGQPLGQGGSVGFVVSPQRIDGLARERKQALVKKLHVVTKRFEPLPDIANHGGRLGFQRAPIIAFSLDAFLRFADGRRVL